MGNKKSEPQDPISQDPQKWFLKSKLSTGLAIVTGLGIVGTGIADLQGEWTGVSWIVLVGLGLTVLAVIFQAVISAKRENEISALSAKVKTARADGMQDAFAELRRGLHELNDINRSGWTPEKSKGFQTRLVDLTFRVLDSMGVPEVRACFYTSLTSEVQPGLSYEPANVQVLRSFYHSGASSRRSPSEEHRRDNDAYKMFGLLKDPRPNIIPRRKSIAEDHKGWKSAIRVGVVGIGGANSSRKIAWGVLTADSTSVDAFNGSSGVVLELMADLIVLARTAETQIPDVRSLKKLRQRIDAAEHDSQEKGEG